MMNTSTNFYQNPSDSNQDMIKLLKRDRQTNSQTDKVWKSHSLQDIDDK